MVDLLIEPVADEESTSLRIELENHCQYVGNSPTNFTDPTGLDSTTNKGCDGSPNVNDVGSQLPNGTWLVVAANVQDTIAGTKGHSWIAIIDKTVDPPIIVTAGFYPNDNADANLSSDKDGQFKDDSKKRFDTARAFRISKEQLEKLAARIASQGKAPGRYQIRTSNCTTFAVKGLHVILPNYAVGEDARAIGADDATDLPFYSPQTLQEALQNDKNASTDRSIIFGEKGIFGDNGGK